MTNKITKSEIEFAKTYNKVDERMHKGEYTRACAAQFALSALFQRGETPSIEKIDDLCFITWGFPISHRKGEPLKTKGGLSVRKRVDKYTYNNDTLHYDINTDSFGIHPDVAKTIHARETAKSRKSAMFTRREQRITGEIKNAPVSAFKTQISPHLYMHLVQGGKLAY